MDQTKIYNMALSSIGTRAVVASPDENSPEAEELNIWYETVRDRILGAAFWPSVKASFRLNLQATRDEDVSWTAGSPQPGWQYAYARPPDMLRPRYLSDYSSFDVGLIDANTPAIFSNAQSPILIYTSRQVTPDLWDTNLQFAIAHALGSVVCLKLTGSRARRDAAWQVAYQLVAEARTAVANDRQQQIDFTPSAMVARGFIDLTGGQTQYMYPYAEIAQSGFGNVS